MATLKIYNDIQTENQKREALFWGEAAGVCYKDIDGFCDAIAEDDKTIDIRLHCDGGSVLEGWAIYDRLRATGKEISATVEGNAASMATVIMMAAPKERRYAYESAQICVHNPWVCPWSLGEQVNADGLQRYADDLRAQQQKMVDLYVERCGCTADEIQALMDEDKYIGVQQAMNLGLIGSIIPPASAKKTPAATAAQYKSQNSNKNKNQMEKNEKNVEVKQSFVDKLLRFFGKKSIAEITFGMDLNTADGNVLTVEREEGAPQVGDSATPDGEWTMPDGSTIVVTDGVITEIKPAEVEVEVADSAEEGDGNGGEEGGNGEETDEKDAIIAELQQQVADLEAENAELKQQVADAKENAKSVDDLRILNAVAMAGGEKALAKFASNYHPEQRQPAGRKAEQQSSRDEMATAIRENIKKMRK